MTDLLLILPQYWQSIAAFSAFALLHSYQGVLGVVRTGVIGVTMGAVFLHTGSLWPPMVAHVLIDLVVGFVLAERLLS